jgi:hypothetical protein
MWGRLLQPCLCALPRWPVHLPAPQRMPPHRRSLSNRCRLLRFWRHPKPNGYRQLQQVESQRCRRTLRQRQRLPTRGRDLQAGDEFVQRREQLLRRQRQSESVRLPAGHSRDPALYDDGAALQRRRRGDWAGLLDECRLLRTAVRAQSELQAGRGGWRGAFRMRRTLYRQRWLLHHDRRLLPRLAVHDAARLDARNLRHPAS